MGWGFGFEDWFEVAVFGAQTTEEVENLARFRDWVADVAELVGETLELCAVIMNRHITLLHIAELGFQKDGAFKLVVSKMAFNIRPEGKGGDVGLVDEIEDVGGDGGADPVDEATVDLSPLGVALGDRRG
jgi:hypothetical protein